jgi:hypothetical protein
MMKPKMIFQWGMYNWALTPAVQVWRNQERGGGFVIHFLRGRIGFWF